MTVVHDGALDPQRVFLVVVAITLLLPGCAGLGNTGQGPSSITQERIAFGEFPTLVMPFGGSMWVLDGRSRLIGKIDPATNEVVDTLDLGDIGGRHSFIADMTAGSNSLWVTFPNERRLYELDPSDGSVLSSLSTDAAVIHFSYLKGSLWFSSPGTRGGVDLVRVDPDRGKVLARWRLGPNNTFMKGPVSFEGSVWVLRHRSTHIAGSGPDATSRVGDQLWLLGSNSNGVRSKLQLGSTLARGAGDPVTGMMVASSAGLWMSRVAERRLVLMSPFSGRLQQEVSVAEFDSPWEFALVGGELWLGDLGQPRVMCIDPASTEKEIVEIETHTSFVGGGFGSAWVPITSTDPQSGRPLGEVVRLTRN